MRLKSLGTPLLLLLIVVGFYWKLTLTRQFDWVTGPDLTEQVLPWFDEEGRQLQHGTLPVWDPHIWTGQPIVGQAQPGAAYPLNWVLFAIPRFNGHIRISALQWYYVLIHYMAALFCYLLCRDLGRSKIASIAAGLVFALGGYVGSIDWPQMLNGAIWTPLVLMFLLRAVRGIRPVSSAALAGLCLGLAWLSGHHQAPIFLALAASGIWIFYLVRGARPRRETAALAGLMFVVTGLVGALQIVPAAEYGKLSVRWVNAPDPMGWSDRVPYSVHSMFSLSPVELFSVVFPGMHHIPNLFVGVAALSLALLALGMWRRDWAVRLFGCLALAVVIYALGRTSVFQGFLYAVVPMLEKARTPRMVVFLFSGAVGVLAAFGLDRLTEAPEPPWPRRLAIASGVFGAGVWVLMLAIFFAQRSNWVIDDRVGVTGLAALLFCALLSAWRTGLLSGRQAQVLATLVIVLELGTGSMYMLADRSDVGRRALFEKLVAAKDAAAFLARQPGPFRIDTEGDLATNWGEYHDFDLFRAMTPSVTENLYKLEYHLRTTKRLFNVRYTLARKSPDPSMREVFTSQSGIKVFEDDGAFPRAWTVHEAVRFDTHNHGLDFVRQRLDELHRTALFRTEPPALTTCAGEDRVSFAIHRPRRVLLRAEMACQGMLVLSEAVFPGWKATLDGREVPIHEVNFGMRGVVIPAGSHELDFYYRPWSVYLGFLLTLTGVVGTIVLVVRDTAPSRSRLRSEPRP